MYFSIRLDWIARIALPTALALCWHVGIVTAQSTTEAGSTPLISWRADAPTSSEQTATLPQATTAPSAPSEIQDAHVAPAVHEATVAPKQPVDARRLTPPSRVAALPDNKLFTTSDALPFDLPKVESLTTAGTGLALVLGLFFLCAWLLRRSGPKPTTPLPREAVAVLGRTPLAGNHFAHLVQLGNKLVLLSISPEGVSPLAEVTDPQEVHRLLGLCLRNQKHSSTAEFHTVLEQLAREGGRGFLGDQAGDYARTGRT